jgi:hypothetical protein
VGKVLDLKPKLYFCQIADKYNYWFSVPKHIRLYFYLEKARKEKSFLSVIEYIEESKLNESELWELMKLSDEDLLKIMQSDKRKARPVVKLMALMKAFDQYYGDQFDHELIEERYNQGKFIYDDDLGYWIEP